LQVNLYLDGGSAAFFIEQRVRRFAVARTDALSTVLSTDGKNLEHFSIN
jgi:hypothetical protein